MTHRLTSLSCYSTEVPRCRHQACSSFTILSCKHLPGVSAIPDSTIDTRDHRFKVFLSLESRTPQTDRRYVRWSIVPSNLVFFCSHTQEGVVWLVSSGTRMKSFENDGEEKWRTKVISREYDRLQDESVEGSFVWMLAPLSFFRSINPRWLAIRAML